MGRTVVGIGEVLWDMLPGGKKLGGAPANFAYHISQFGLSSCVVSAIGNDTDGVEMQNELNSLGLCSMLATVPYPTGTVDIKIDTDGIPSYNIRENVAWDNIPFTHELEDLSTTTQAVCFGTLSQRSEVSRSTIHKFLDSVPDDCLRVFDANLRQDFYNKSILSDSMLKCNILKINDEELKTVCSLFNCPKTGDFKKSCKWLLDEFGLQIIILTCGINGSYVFTKDTMSFQPTPEVEVEDTVGAGDSFTASFVANLLKGKSIIEAHAIAAKISAFVCTQSGAMPLLPDELVI